MSDLKSGGTPPTTTTTLRLPRSLHERLKVLASNPRVTIHSLLLDAAYAHVRQLEREAIDRDFEGMANDPIYQKESLQLCQEFAFADAQAFRMHDVQRVTP